MAAWATVLERIYDSYVIGSVATLSSTGNHHIWWPPVCTWEDEATLLAGVEDSFDCQAMNVVPDSIMPRDPLSPVTTAQGMVTKSVTVAEASRTWSCLFIDVTAQPVFGGLYELQGGHVKAKGRDWGNPSDATLAFSLSSPAPTEF